MRSSKTHKSRKTTYILVFGDTKYRINAEIFSTCSKKFADLYVKNPGQLVFNEKVSEETFSAFISACQQQSYSISPQNAFELLQLARDWDVADLERYALGVCRQNGIKVRPKYDPIGILVQHLDQECETVEDFKNVAGVIEESYDDELITDIDADVLFRIFTIAEKKPTFDMKKFKDFVLGLYEDNPGAAVLLTLLIDFNDLTNEESELILHQREMREQSIGFFVSQALSLVRRKAKQQVFDCEMRHQSNLDLFRRQNEYDNMHMKQNLIKYQEEAKKAIEKRIEDQKQQVQRLVERVTKTAICMDKGSLSQTGVSDPTLQEIRVSTENTISQLFDKIRRELTGQKEERHQTINNSINNAAEQWKLSQCNFDQIRQVTAEQLHELNSNKKDYEKAIDSIDLELDDVQSAICAKIVKDRLRFDKGMRNTEQRLMIFDEEPRIMNLSSETVQRAEQLLNSIDARLDEQCPIRGGNRPIEE